MWKWVHGYTAWTDLSMDAWIKSPDYLKHYRQRIQIELSQPPEKVNHAVLCDLCTRIGDIGDCEMDQVAMTKISEMTENGVLKDVCAKAAAKLKARLEAAK